MRMSRLEIEKLMTEEVREALLKRGMRPTQVEEITGRARKKLVRKLERHRRTLEMGMRLPKAEEVTVRVKRKLMQKFRKHRIRETWGECA